MQSLGWHGWPRSLTFDPASAVQGSAVSPMPASVVAVSQSVAECRLVSQSVSLAPDVPDKRWVWIRRQIFTDKVTVRVCRRGACATVV